jgi:hypothetical protein
MESSTQWMHRVSLYSRPRSLRRPYMMSVGKVQKGLPIKTTISSVEANMMLCPCQWLIRGDGYEAYNWLVNPVWLHLWHTNDNNNWCTISFRRLTNPSYMPSLPIRHWILSFGQLWWWQVKWVELF